MTCQLYTEVAVCLYLSSELCDNAGLTHLSSHEGGKAVRCAGEAKSLSQSASKAAGLFDKAVPASLPADHAQLDGAFIDCVTNVYNKVRLPCNCASHICSRSSMFYLS